MNVSQLKPLTATQYDAVKAQALKRIETRIGDKPTRKQFKREYGAIFGILDIFALIVFAAALAISSVHILSHVMIQSATKQAETIETLGIVISAHDATVIQQIGMVVLAEFAMLLFMTVWSIERKKPMHTRTDQLQTHSMLILAFTSMVFVIVANISTGIGVLESIMPPVFTIGVGLRLEHIIVEMIKRRDAIDKKYTSALESWERAIDDPTSHSDYQSVMRRAIWDKLVSYRANSDFMDAPTSFKVAAVMREMERDNWAKYANFDTAKASQRYAIEEPAVTEEDTQEAEAVTVDYASMPSQIESYQDKGLSIATTAVVTQQNASNDNTMPAHSVTSNEDSGDTYHDGRTCDNCGTPIPDSARVTQRFCNKACRQADYRKRNNADAGV